MEKCVWLLVDYSLRKSFCACKNEPCVFSTCKHFCSTESEQGKSIIASLEAGKKEDNRIRFLRGKSSDFNPF